MAIQVTHYVQCCLCLIRTTKNKFQSKNRHIFTYGSLKYTSDKSGR